MKKATRKHKEHVIDILVKTFESNLSVNYIIKQDHKKTKRVRALMDYSFELCMHFGEVFLSDNEQGCLLVLYPDKKKLTFRSLLLDVKLVFRSIGWQNLHNAIEREEQVNMLHADKAISHFWYMGVDPKSQHKGIGRGLIEAAIKYSFQNGRPVCLETTTTENMLWYKRLGFEVYGGLDLGYHQYFMKREIGIAVPRPASEMPPVYYAMPA